MTRVSSGWVNAHTHMYSGLAPLEMPVPSEPPQNFLGILERVWWRLDRALDADSLRAAARLYVAEALLKGTTGLIDHHESPDFIPGSLDVLADACQDLGMRAVLCYGVTERNNGRAEAEAGLLECERFLTSNERPLVRGVVGVHASFTVSDETLKAAGALARRLGTVVHIHLAEDSVDLEDARERGFKSPLARLLALDALPVGSILAHGVYLTRNEVALCTERGFWIVQNPRSNRGNAVGYPLALEGHSRVALGTDGFPSDMLDEGEALIMEAAHREDLDGAMARISRGHELLAELFGSDEIDVALTPGNLKIGGRQVVENGELLTADFQAIRELAVDQASRLWDRMEAL